MGSPVVHFEIGCRDKDRSAKFYEAAFGWKTGPYGDAGKIVDTGSDAGVQGHITALGHEPHAYVLCYIEVEDVAAALDRVEAEGGARFIGPYEIESQRRQFAWFKDPDGNTMGLLGPQR